ncbi:MAG: serine/threonine-protein kinase, partial [Planctomycetota bacterium]
MTTMEAEKFEPTEESEGQPIEWEAFYKNYRKPGYIQGFEIVNKLGGGVFGIVYKARKESIGKDYAIKFLKVDDEVVRDAVVRELNSVRFFAQVDHPNLVSIEDKGDVDGIPFIVMSYAGQTTLRKRLDHGPLEREEALRLFIQAARGVQALHEHSLVHFDLKPANIFLKGEIARVGDYGLSKLVTESRNSLSFGRGTPYYMAPEMLERRGDQRSDIYSLGIILYECLVGDVPFKGDSEWEVLRKHELESPEFPDSMGAVERRVISKCLAKKAEDRYQAVKDLLRDLQAPASLGESMVIPPRVSAGTAASPRPIASEGGSESARETGAGVPWQDYPEDDGVRGIVGGMVHMVFRLFELVIFLILVPVRLLSTSAGQILKFVLQLPFRILGV